MKRIVTIKGFIGENGQVIMGVIEDEFLEDRTDLALYAEDFDRKTQIREITATFEIDTDKIFGDVQFNAKTVIGEKNVE